MMLQIKRWLASPVFPDDENKTRRAIFLNSALLTSMALSLCLIVGNLAGGTVPAAVTGLAIVVFAACLVLRRWAYQGRVGLTSGALLAAGLVGITMAVALLGTIRAPATALYMLLVIMAGLLFDLSGMIVMTVLCSLAVAGLIVAENTGLLPRPDYTVTITQWVTYTVLFAWTGSLTFSALRSVRQALARAEQEITERKWAEETRRAAEAQFRGLFENVPDGVYRSTLEGKFLLVNPTLVRTLGYASAEELLAIDISCGMYADPAARRAWTARLLQEGELRNVEISMRRKDGQPLVGLENTRVVRDERGDVLYFEGTLTDITARKRAEEALRESEERFRHLSDAAFEGITIHEGGVLLSATKRFFEMFGFEPDELLGKQTIPLTIAPEAREFMRKQIATGSSVPYESIGLRKDGTKFPMEIRAREMEYKGRKVRAVALMDITARKRAEEMLRESEARYRVLAETAPDMIFVIDRDDRVQYVNTFAARQFGATPAQVIGKPRADLFPPDIAGQQGQSLRRVFDSGEPLFNEETIRFGEREMWISNGLVPLRDASGVVTAVMGISRDITERKQAEEALRQAEENYRSIFENAVEGIYQSSVQGRFTSVNSAMARILGYASPDEVVTRITSIRDQFYADPGRRTIAMQQLEEKGTLENFESECLRKDGSRIWISENVRAVRDANGTLLYYEGFVQDITARKRAEEALRKSNQLLERTFASLRDAVFIIDAATTEILDCNLAAPEIFGYSREEMLGRTTAFLHVDQGTLEEFRQRLNSAVEESGFLFLPEFRMKRKDGTDFPTEHSVVPLEDKQGKHIGWVSVVRDITDRKRAEDALRASEEKHRTILENIEEGYFEVDIAGNFTFFNESVCRLLGYSRSEMMGMNNRHYTDQTNAQKLYRAFNQVYRTGVSAQGHDWELIRKDGTKRYVECSVSLRKNKSSQPIGFRGIIRDVTERKCAENALRESERALAEAQGIAHLGNWSWDRDTGAMQWSREMFNIYDIVPSEVAPSHEDIMARVHENNLPEYLSRFEKALRSGNAYELDHRLVTPTRGNVWVHTRVKPRLDETGRVTGLFGTSLDITERKRAEEEREGLLQEVLRAREQLQILSRQSLAAQENERREIARELHDEIGQVLTAVKTNLQLIQLTPEPATLEPRLEESNQIVDQALDRIRTLALDLRPSLLDDFGLVTALEWYLERQGHRAGFIVEFSAEPHEMRLPETLESTCFRLVQAALTNVERHARATKVQVFLRQTQVPRAVELSVRDDGIGFDVPAALARAARGESLGLIGMQERARLAGGWLAIESAPGRGTEIRVQFPIKDEERRMKDEV